MDLLWYDMFCGHYVFMEHSKDLMMMIIIIIVLLLA